METRQFLSGNEAIAYGAYKAGCGVAAAYPGTPSTEILQAVSRFKERIYCEWSVNEKVAMEVVIGAAFAGKRALTAMKHVGLNVALDPLMTTAYLQLTGGLVIASCDDPGMHSSQNEQDNRYLAKFGRLPLLEPSDSQEAYEMTIEAFALSEAFAVPVILRMTTRTSHSAGVVELGDFTPLPPTGRTYVKDITKTIPIPVHARRMRREVQARTEGLRELAETHRFNRIEPGSPEIGIITSGIAYQYVKEVFPEASVLKLGFTFPLPHALIRQFAAGVNKLYVIEECEPFLEEQIRAMGITVEDHQTELLIGELNPTRVRQLRAEIDGASLPAPRTLDVMEGLPARPPVLCAGCGHRSVFYALNRLKATVTGDIGCYSLGMFKPLDAMDTIVCMGAAIGNAEGFEKAGYPRTRIAAVIGDSTFFHSGITGLLNCVYNKAATTVIVLDNRTTAMTGHQDHPGTGKTLMGEETVETTVEQVAHGLGVKRVRVIDCYDMAEVERVLAEELDAPETSVVVAKRPCALNIRLRMRQLCIDQDACNGCRRCLQLGCPALELGAVVPHAKRRQVRINPVLCAGCGMCTQVCRSKAIKAVEESG